MDTFCVLRLLPVQGALFPVTIPTDREVRHAGKLEPARKIDSVCGTNAGIVEGICQSLLQCDNGDELAAHTGTNR